MNTATAIDFSTDLKKRATESLASLARIAVTRDLKQAERTELQSSIAVSGSTLEGFQKMISVLSECTALEKKSANVDTLATEVVQLEKRVDEYEEETKRLFERRANELNKLKTSLMDSRAVYAVALDAKKRLTDLKFNNQEIFTVNLPSDLSVITPIGPMSSPKYFDPAAKVVYVSEQLATFEAQRRDVVVLIANMIKEEQAARAFNSFCNRNKFVSIFVGAWEKFQRLLQSDPLPVPVVIKWPDVLRSYPQLKEVYDHPADYIAALSERRLHMKFIIERGLIELPKKIEVWPLKRAEEFSE